MFDRFGKISLDPDESLLPEFYRGVAADILISVITRLTSTFIPDGIQPDTSGDQSHVNGRFPLTTIVALTAGKGFPERNYRCRAGGRESLRYFLQNLYLNLRVVSGVGHDYTEPDIRQAVKGLIKKPAKGSQVLKVLENWFQRYRLNYLMIL